MRARYDVVVVGGGPAGATTAALLAKRGRRVLLLEREPFPRFRVGESLLPQSCGVLEELGVLARLEERFMHKFGATFVCSDTCRTSAYLFAEAFDDRYDHAFQVERGEFDALLLERARELGAEVRQPCRVRRVLFEGERATGVELEAGGARETVHAEVVVDAAGRGALIPSARRGRQRIAGLDKVSVFAHYRGVERMQGKQVGDVQIVMSDDGWYWVIPFRGAVTSIGAVISSDYAKQRRGLSNTQLLQASLDDSRYMTGILQNAERCGEVMTAADFSYRLDHMVGDGWLSVGDAGGFVDPLFSSGVHLAIRGAGEAAAAIDQALQTGRSDRAAFLGYEDVMKRAGELFAVAVQAAYDGSFRELLFLPGQRQNVRRVITSILAGDVVHAAGAEPNWIRFARAMYRDGLARLTRVAKAHGPAANAS